MGCTASIGPKYENDADEAVFEQWSDTFLRFLRSNEMNGFQINESNVFLKIELFIGTLQDNPRLVDLLLKNLGLNDQLNADFKEQLQAIVKTNKLKVICSKGETFNSNEKDKKKNKTEDDDGATSKIDSNAYYVLYLSAWNGINEIIADFNNPLDVDKKYNAKKPLENMRWETWMNMYYFN